MLRMVNVMVDSYLELRQATERARSTTGSRNCCGPRARAADWAALMAARRALHTLEDLCEDQNDAMQEWLDTAREQPPPALTAGASATA